MAAADVAAAMAVAVVVAVVVAMWLVPKEEAVQAEAVAAKALEMSVAVAAAEAMSVTVVAVAVATSMANLMPPMFSYKQEGKNVSGPHRAIELETGRSSLSNQNQSDSVRLSQTQSTQRWCS